MQGVAVLNENSNWEDFRPGMELKEVLNVFLPKYENQNSFIMASHVERLKESQCFQFGELSCITCHNPHISVKTVTDFQFNKTCQSCHSGEHEVKCAEEMEVRNSDDNNCIKCHMPKSGSIDIPHVAITDHNISVPGKEGSELSETAGDRFLGLKCLTDDNPSNLTMAKGYLRFYEGFNASPVYLDSAYYYLSQIDKETAFTVWVHYYYLQNGYQDIVNLAGNHGNKDIYDANTLFRIGEAFMNVQGNERATTYFEQAVAIEPYNLDFQNRLGSNYLYIGAFQKARETFERILDEQDSYVPALSNLGTLEINIGDSERGTRLLEKAIDLDPDYELAYFNLAEYYQKRAENDEAKGILNRLLQNRPGHVGAIEKMRE